MINIRVLKGCRLYEGEQDLLLRALQYQRLAYYVTDLFFFFYIFKPDEFSKKGEYLEYWKQVVDSFECLSN